MKNILKKACFIVGIIAVIFTGVFLILYTYGREAGVENLEKLLIPFGLNYDRLMTLGFINIAILVLCEMFNVQWNSKKHKTRAERAAVAQKENKNDSNKEI